MLTIAPGERHDLVLELSDRPLPAEPVTADAKAGRNYDYRYAWIRDQCYAGQAVAADGPHRLLDDAVSFVAASLLDDGPHLKPAYTVTGGAVPDEHSLSGLAGYPGGSDKVGNWVNKQFQLDALGEALLLPAIRGATTADDSRARATLRAVEEDLARDGYLYRFRHDQRALHEAEGAFVLCGFLMAMALHQQGREREAVGWFERNHAACGPPALLTEEFVYLPAVNTPQFDWCATTLDRHPQPVPPIYQPELIAKFILEAALTGRRQKVIGSWNKVLVLAGRMFPGLGNQYAGRAWLVIPAAPRRRCGLEPGGRLLLAGAGGTRPRT